MRKRLDLTGMRFGTLEALSIDTSTKRTHVHWICRCDCGVIKSVRGSHLTGGKTVSCGCQKPLLLRKAQLQDDLAGRVFGRLTVVALVINSTAGKHQWLCRCECGNMALVYRGALIQDKVRSCGCLAEEVRAVARSNGWKWMAEHTGDRHPNWNPLLRPEDRMRRRSVTGYQEWRITVYRLWHFRCAICGKHPKRGQFTAHHLYDWQHFPERQLDPTNGVALCGSCHKSYHRETGGNSSMNTEEQFLDYLEAMINDRESQIIRR
jgi:hypothetical protein